MSMSPTLMDSLSTSLQTLFGLVAGIWLALLVLIMWGPSVWTITLVAGAGIVLSGTGCFGAGRAYVPIASLFVLIVGGSNLDDYSFGYATHMAVGVTVGLVVDRIEQVGDNDPAAHEVCAHAAAGLRALVVAAEGTGRRDRHSIGAESLALV